MLTTFERFIDQADGDFLRPEHLEHLASYNKSFAERSETYHKIQKLETKIVEQVLKQSGQDDDARAQEVTLMVRMAAMAMLLDDATYFKEHYLEWQVTQAQAYGSQARLYRHANLLIQTLPKYLPAPQAALFRPFFDLICQALL